MPKGTIIAFSIAENGAMGNPGNITLLTDQNELYEFNYIYDQKESIFKEFQVLKKCIDYINKVCMEVPDGWKHIDMVAGNHLFLLEWLDILFCKTKGSDILPSDIYAVWIDTVNSIMKHLSSRKEYTKEKSDYRSDLNIIPYDAERKNMGNSGCIRENLSVKWNSISNRTEKIVAIGINPSTAENGKSDTTVTKLCRFLDQYGFNNVTMINLFESVSSDQNRIDQKTQTDFSKKRGLLDDADIILIVWGIDGHKEKKREAASILAEYADKLYCIRNQNGKYPAHPSRMSYTSTMVKINFAADFAACGLCPFPKVNH